MDDFLEHICEIASGGGGRQSRAEKIAASIMARGGYRWVGLYDVRSDLVSIIAWTGPGAPAHPTFPVTQGLTSAAITQKSAIVVNDVSLDPRYLTAFGNTRSEMIIPVVSHTNGRVIGTIDVESEKLNAFSAADQKKLEECAVAALPLWSSP